AVCSTLVISCLALFTSALILLTVVVRPLAVCSTFAILLLADLISPVFLSTSALISLTVPVMPLIETSSCPIFSLYCCLSTKFVNSDFSAFNSIASEFILILASALVMRSSASSGAGVQSVATLPFSSLGCEKLIIFPLGYQ